MDGQMFRWGFVIVIAFYLAWQLQEQEEIIEEHKDLLIRQQSIISKQREVIEAQKVYIEYLEGATYNLYDSDGPLNQNGPI